MEHVIANVGCGDAAGVKEQKHVRSGYSNITASSLTRLLPSPLSHFAKLLLRPDYRRRMKEFRRLRNMPPYQPTVTNLLGKPLKILDAPSFLWMEREIFRQNIYAFAAKSSSPRIIDGGANIGMSVLFFKKLYPESRIIAFEPDPTVFAILNENIRLHGIENVELWQRALWTEETELDFASEGADGGRVARGDDVGSSRVKTICLSSFLKEPVEFLKLDIEGSETEVLVNCAEHLNNVTNIFVEYHSFASERQTLHRLLSTLDGAGFRLHVHPSIQSPQPFLRRETRLGLDLALNIFGYRV